MNENLIARCAAASMRWADRLTAKPVRWVGLLILLASYLAVLVNLFPMNSGNSELVSDLRSRHASVVLVDTDGSEVFVQWSTGPLSHKAETYRFDYGNPGSAGAVPAFEQSIEKDVAGSGATVRFEAFDPSFGFGGISLLAFALYPRVLGWSALAVGSYAVGILILGSLLLSNRRRVERPSAWFWICVLTGFGFFAWLWVEPSPLLTFSAKRRRSRRSSALGILAPLGATGIAAALLVVIGIAFVWTIHSSRI